MKKAIMTVATLTLMAGCGNGNEEEVNLIQSAEGFINQVVEGEYEAAVEKFDERTRESLPAEQLEIVWNELEDTYGTFVHYEYEETIQEQDLEILRFAGSFEEVETMLTVTFNEEEEIVGFLIQ
ncbi:DUF3887 domain-containing protein [Bacillus sp. JCM 19041]|uniref:DUF3887 domain-containing protein n=1 Tax=Bacillus sp. JCM 19041 TaxID=1460637 RepID=UPI0006D2112F